MKIAVLLVTLFLTSAVYPQHNHSGFTLKARLVKAEPLQVSCSVLAVAVTQQFQVTDTDLPFLKPGMFILLNMPCPYYQDKQFFTADQQYEIRASCNDKDYSNFLLFNNYKNTSLPCYWIADIRKLSL